MHLLESTTLKSLAILVDSKVITGFSFEIPPPRRLLTLVLMRFLILVKCNRKNLVIVIWSVQFLFDYTPFRTFLRNIYQLNEKR